MYKLTITLLFFIATWIPAKGQTDTLIHYISDAGNYVESRDSATTIRKIYKASEQDSLYIVRDYYKNGNLKFTVNSYNSDGSSYSGYAVEFYPNGNKKSDEFYVGNHLIGPLTSYFPNGELYITGEITTTGIVIVKQCRDTSGTIQATEGNGMVITYDEHYKRVISFGSIRDGLRIGRWTCTPNDSTVYIVNYKNGLPVSQAGIDANRKEYPFVFTIQNPAYKEGGWALYDLVESRLAKVRAAKKTGVSGTIHIKLTVEADGTVSNVKVTEGLGHGLDEEAIKATESTSRSWIPQKIYGIPTRCDYNFTVNYGLNTMVPTVKYHQ